MSETVWVVLTPAEPYECSGDLISIHRTQAGAEAAKAEFDRGGCFECQVEEWPVGA